MAANDDKGTEGGEVTEGRHLVTLSPCHLVIRGKPVVGLIGGIGSGKSRVAAEFARRGARVVSGDDLAHAALRQPEVREQVARRWGPQVLDAQGEVNRRRLAEIVFAEP